jgi:hypothetical protein
MGRHRDAERHLRRALELEGLMDARPFRARTLAALSRVWRTRDPGRAKEVAGEAITLAGSLGAAGIVAEVAATVGPAGGATA